MLSRKDSFQPPPCVFNVSFSLVFFAELHSVHASSCHRLPEGCGFIRRRSSLSLPNERTASSLFGFGSVQKEWKKPLFLLPALFFVEEDRSGDEERVFFVRDEFSASVFVADMSRWMIDCSFSFSIFFLLLLALLFSLLSWSVFSLFSIREQDVETILDWSRASEEEREIPFVPARVLLQDFT